MNRIKFLKQLTPAELIEIAENLAFNYVENGFRKGSSIEVGKKSIIAQSWDHDYSSSKDYDEDYIEFNDHEVLEKSLYSANELVELNATLFDLMSLRFGESYKKAHEAYIEELRQQMQEEQKQSQPE